MCENQPGSIKWNKLIAVDNRTYLGEATTGNLDVDHLAWLVLELLVVVEKLKEPRLAGRPRASQQRLVLGQDGVRAAGVVRVLVERDRLEVESKEHSEFG